MGQEIDGEVMDDEAYKGYVFRITGGNDKQGFQMKQGIMSNSRTRILFKSRKSAHSNLSQYLIIEPSNLKFRWFRLQARPQG